MLIFFSMLFSTRFLSLLGRVRISWRILDVVKIFAEIRTDCLMDEGEDLLEISSNIVSLDIACLNVQVLKWILVKTLGFLSHIQNMGDSEFF